MSQHICVVEWRIPNALDHVGTAASDIGSSDTRHCGTEGYSGVTVLEGDVTYLQTDA